MNELLKKKLPSFVKKKPGKDTMIILVLIGILLAIIVWPSSDKKSLESDIQDNENVILSEEIIRTDSQEEYCTETEQKLEEILSQMEGVGKVEVMITLSDTGQTVVEKDEGEQVQKSSEAEEERYEEERQREENTVFVETEEGRYPYVIQEKYPKIEGVLVVAEGGGESEVNMNVTRAIQALFPIETHKIRVVKMNPE